MKTNTAQLIIYALIGITAILLSCLPGTAEETIYLDSDYTLQNDMSFSEGQGFIINTNNITIDGAGYCIDGVSAQTPTAEVNHFGIYNVGYDNITIKNLEIKNFYNGIYFTYDPTTGNIVYNNSIINCNIHHNGRDDIDWTESQGIKLIGVSDSIITQCEIHHNTGVGTACEDGGNGLFIMGTSSGDGGKRNTVTYNTIYNNTKGGFFTKQQPQYTIVSNNTITGNGQGGIILRCKLSNDHLIENNIVTDNYGCGIFIGGENNVIKNNRVEHNKNGSLYIGVVGEYGTGVNFGRSDGSKDNYLLNNIICDNDCVDVKAHDTNQNTGNIGQDNTGGSAINYHDEGQDEETPFTYTCTKQKSTTQTPETQEKQTPGFSFAAFFCATLIFLIHSKNKTKGGKK